MRKVLICNDDGYDSEGIQALVDEFKKDYEVYVVAPAHQQSGQGHSYSNSNSLVAKKVNIEGAKVAYSLDGKPTECVRYALQYLCPEKPDLIVSGINWGANLGSDCVTSGTVGAALEALLFEYPSMAVSIANPEPGKFGYAAKVAHEMAATYLEDPTCHQYIFNLNLPYPSPEQILGITAAKSDGIRRYEVDHKVERKEDEIIFHQSRNFEEFLVGMKDSIEYDISAEKKGYIVVQPLTYDLVDHTRIEQFKSYESYDWKN